MTWTRLSDDYVEQLEALDLSPQAMWLHTAALVYCNRLGLDGRLSVRVLPRLTLAIHAAEVDMYVAELEQQGVWTRDGIAGWKLDWSDQEPADLVSSRKAQAAARQRRFKRHRAGLHDECDPRRCDSAPAGEVTRYPTRYPTRDVTRSETRPRPYPSLPEGVGTGSGDDKPRCAHGVRRAADGSGCAECADAPTAEAV